MPGEVELTVGLNPVRVEQVVNHLAQPRDGQVDPL